MIDIMTEKLLTLAQAAALLPDHPSTATLWRWRVKGRNGRLLETVTLGGKVYTSVEALQRFAEQSGGVILPSMRSPTARERAINKAERELAKARI
jgi:hypothetical protein